MDLFLVFIGIVLVLMVYFGLGGVGGLVGRAVRATRPALPPPAGVSIASVASGPREGSGRGFSKADALAEVDAYFANDLNVFGLRIGDLSPDIVPRASLKRTAETIAHQTRSSRRDPGVPAQVETEIFAFVEQQAVQALAVTVISRTLRNLRDEERAALRMAQMLKVLGRISARDLLEIQLPIIWNEGRCRLDTAGSFNRADRMVELRKGVTDLVTAHGGPADMAVERATAALRATLAAPEVLGTDKAVLERYLFGGARWQTPADTSPKLTARGKGRTRLFLGRYDDGREFEFDMAESLITIAGPGSGKSQAHVLRNLLRLEGGAMVLDIKGEMFEHSSAWRSTFGQVVRFAPGSAGSVALNPLDWVRPDHIWDDADRLAKLLFVMPDHLKGDAYFQQRSISLITIAVAYIALTEEGPTRTMYAVVQLLYEMADPAFLKKWTEYLTGTEAVKADPDRGIEAKEATAGDTRIPQLVLEAKTLANIPAKQREGFIDGTRGMLSVWLSPEVSAVTDRTDFRASMLRSGGTLYLCVADDDVERLATVIRVVIGIMMRGLQTDGTEADRPIVTFFLDEMPRLQKMPLIETMLDIGRGYGIRMWLFAQNFGQLRARYENADGILKNCAARTFMNIDIEDAQHISKLLGEREGLLDGRRKPLAEPWELAGPEYEDKVLVFHRSGLPARLTKIMAFDDPVCRERKGRVVSPEPDKHT